MPAAHIQFEGLISFVIRQIQGVTILDVLLPSMQKPVVSQRNPRNILSSHIPCLLFDSRHPIAGLPADSAVIERKKGSDQVVRSERVVFLKQENLGFHTSQSQAGVAFELMGDIPGPQHPIPLNDAEKRDYRWIAPMAKVCENGGEIDPDCLGTNSKKLVSVRSQFREGKFVSRDFSLNEDRTISLYDFPEVGGVKWKQALTETATLETSVTNALEVSGVNANGTRLVIQPIPFDANPISVSLLNLEPEHLLMDVTSDDEDPLDFEIFFELVDRRPPRAPRDIPSRTKSAGDRICPMSRFG